MTKAEKESMGTGLMQYYNDVNAWYKAEEEDMSKKEHYSLLLDCINILLDSFKENLELDEY